jgi:glucoamylase
MADATPADLAGLAPGAPGIAPTWTSSAKDMVGATLGRSRVWFTLGFGIVNEVYYPRVDAPQIRDLGFIVADGKGFWVEVKRLENYTVRLLATGTPAVEIVHTHARFTLTLRITPDPVRDALLVDVRLAGDEGLRPYVLLAPRLGMSGEGNTAAVERHGVHTCLVAGQEPFALALAAVDADGHDAIGRGSAGYVGASDGWQDFDRNGALTTQYSRAGPGNVALIGELPRNAVLALGFGDTIEAAATLAGAALAQPFDNSLKHQISDWTAWHARRNESALMRPDEANGLGDALIQSAMVLRSHRDKTYPGSMVASLSVPWGNSRNDLGGYHLVWPRDLVECAMALLALGAHHEARETLIYLIATQKADGSWNQNQWLDGTPYWTGVQLDETAFPVLLAAALAGHNALHGIAIGDMIERALGFIARTGPSSGQDRWEENAGISVFTLSVCVAALVAGAPFLGEAARAFALALADFWNASIEAWTSVSGTAMARQLGVRGYYVRIAPADVLSDPASLQQALEIRNRMPGRTVPADEEVSVDFLQLVRLGLRSPNDPLIRDSIAVADELLSVDTPKGPSWHRYNGDGYGEHEDGSPFDGSGRGRAWPLLTGERGHHALVAGEDPMPYLAAMAAMTGPAGMMPEQVWDDSALPELRLFPGQPTGSAMPLAWAHAEFIKLLVSRHLGYPVDRPPEVWKRYAGRRPEATRAVWSLHAPIGRIARNVALIIALPSAATVRWGTNGWQNPTDVETNDTGLGVHTVEIDRGLLAGAGVVDFTVRWRESDAWEGRDFHVTIGD